MATDNFPARLAEELLPSPREPAAAPLGEDEEEAVLQLASLVAHATERKNAPIACYVAGLYAGAQFLFHTGYQQQVVVRPHRQKDQHRHDQHEPMDLYAE